MGAAPSQPSCVGGQVTLVAKSAPCSAGLFEPDLAMGGLPCTLQEYDAILNAARPLGQPAPCQNGCARPRTGDEVCLRLNASFPHLAFSVNTQWIQQCEKYW
jgi:hypothetical protein